MAATAGPVTGATAGPVSGLMPGSVDQDEKAVIGKFLIGYAALWVVLTAGTELDSTADAAAALAVAIAITATFLYLPKVTQNLGLGG